MFFASLPAAAATITSAQSGDWFDAATWAGGIVPGAGDDVVIAATHTVSTFNPITVTGTLTINGTLNSSGGTLNHIVAGPAGSWNPGSFTSYTISGNVTNNSANLLPANQSFFNFQNAGGTQSISGNLLQFGTMTIATATVSATAPIRSTSVSIQSGNSFLSGDGSEFDSISGNRWRPALGALSTVGQMNITTFEANEGTVRWQPTSFPLSVAAFTFNNLVVPANSTLIFSGTVTGVLTIDGAMSVSGSNAQFNDIVAGAAASMNTFSFFNVSGNVSTANANLFRNSFFAAMKDDTSGIRLNGLSTQTMTDGTFVGHLRVAGSSVGSRFRSNELTIESGSVNPRDGSEFGQVNVNSGSFAPASGATVTVKGIFGNGSFIHNNGTIRIGRLSWDTTTGPFTAGGFNGGLVFHNVTITAATIVQLSATIGGTLTIDGTLMRNGSLDVNRIVAGATAQIPNSSGALTVRGNVESANPVLFGNPQLQTGDITFDGPGVTLSDNLYVTRAILAANATLSGKVRFGEVWFGAGSSFRPAHGSEIGSVGNGIGSAPVLGTFAPAAGASVTVQFWGAVATFVHNDGEIVCARPSFSTTPVSGVSGLPQFTFYNLRITAGSFYRSSGTLRVENTLYLDGELNSNITTSVHDIVGGAAGRLGDGSSGLVVTGDVTSPNWMLFSNQPLSVAARILFSGTVQQDIGERLIYIMEVSAGSSVRGKVEILAGLRLLGAGATFDALDGSLLGIPEMSTGSTLNLIGSGTYTLANAPFFPFGQTGPATFNTAQSLVRFRRIDPTPVTEFRFGSWSYHDVDVPANGQASLEGASVRGTLTVGGSIQGHGSAAGAGIIHDLVLGGSQPSSGVKFSGFIKISGDVTNDYAFGDPRDITGSNLSSARCTFTGITRLFGTPFSCLSATVAAGASLTGTMKIAEGSISGSFTPANGSLLGPSTIFSTGMLTPAEGATITMSGGFVNMGVFEQTSGTIIVDRAFVLSAVAAPAPITTVRLHNVVVLPTAPGSALQNQMEVGAACRLTLTGTLTSSEPVIAQGAFGSLGLAQVTLNHVVLQGTAGRLESRRSGDGSTPVPFVIKGNVTNQHARLLSDGLPDVILSGTAHQTIGGSATWQTIDLTVNNPFGVSSTIPLVATNQMNLLSGNVNMGTEVLAAVAVTRTSGHVIGRLTKLVTTLGTPITFELGTAAGYAPVTAIPQTATGSFTPGPLTVGILPGAHPASPATNALQRWWSVGSPQIATVDLTFSYLDSEVPASESALRVARYAGGWTFTGQVPDTTANTLSLPGATMADYVLAPRPTRFAFGPINSGANARAAIPFPVEVRALDADGGASIVVASTDVNLGLDPSNSGLGVLGGTLGGTMPAQSSSTTLPGVTYSRGATGIRLKATRGFSGESLTEGTSQAFNVGNLVFEIGVPATSTAGQTVNATLTVKNPSGLIEITYAGTVSFSSSDPLANGPAPYAFTPTDGGVHTFNITLNSGGSQTITFGDPFNATFATASINVSKAASSTSLISSVNPSPSGQSVTLTVNVTGGTRMPTGNVMLKEGATVLATQPLSNGSATFVRTFSAGTHNLVASYPGDATYLGGDSPTLAQSVNKSDTTTSFTSSANPSVYGESVAFHVTMSGGGGTVNLLDGGTIIATATLNGSSEATFNISTLSVGSHALKVVYAGDANNNGSESTVIDQMVGKASTSTVLPSSANPSAFGQMVTLTATILVVAPGGGIPAGSITFAEGGTTLGTGAVDATGKATLATNALAVGTHTITATYNGDQNFIGSAASLDQVVALATTNLALTSSSNPSLFGQAVTFFAAVTSNGASPTGSITFKDGTTVLATVALTNGSATFVASGLRQGTHPISAEYLAAAGLTSSAASLNQMVNIAGTTVTLTSSLNPATFGQPVTFTAAVASTLGTPTGTVTFRDGATVLGTQPVLAGSAALTTSLGAGTRSITATYDGDGNFSSAVASLLQVIEQATTTTALTSSGPISTATQSVTFTVNVTSGGGIPSGNVIFSDGTTPLATVALTNGAATFTTSSLAVGAHTITARYEGTPNFKTSSATLTQTVNAAGTALTLASSPNPSTFGQVVTFAITATSSAGIPTGMITLREGTTTLATGPLNSGLATFTLSTLTVGAHTIVVELLGSAQFGGGTSPPIVQVIGKASSTTTVSTSAPSAAFGQAVTFTANVAGSGGAPTGTINFFDGATQIGTATLSNGSASLTTAALAVGVHSIVAKYAGDSNYTASESQPVSQAVSPAHTATQLTSLVNPSTFGQSITVTAMVTSLGGVPNGTVTFREGATILATVPLNNGTAAFTTSSLSAGVHSLVAEYSGATNFFGSASGFLTQIVNGLATNTALASSASSIPFGTQVTFTATITALSGTPTGSVTFLDGQTALATVGLINGVGSLSTSSLALGTHLISAAYAGSGGFLASASTQVTLLVTEPLTHSTISPNTACQGKDPFTLTATGSGFSAGTRIFWNGSPRATLVVNNTTLTATIGTTDTLVATNITVSVMDAAGNLAPSPRIFAVAQDTTLPIMTPPAPISVVPTTTQGNKEGATPATSPALNAWLLAGTATDNCSTTLRLIPQIRVQGQMVDVTSATFFEGKTRVTFRQSDAAGNVATAESEVTVEKK